MSEGLPKQPLERAEKMPIAEYVRLAREIIEGHENFPFTGLNQESYTTIKADQEEYPGYSTPIDELLARFQNEGMKVVLGKNPESGNVFILPSGSDDIENDNLFPRHLEVTEDINPKLKRLILANKK